MLLCFAVTEGPDGCHFVRNRCWMFQLPGQVTRQGGKPLSVSWSTLKNDKWNCFSCTVWFVDLDGSYLQCVHVACLSLQRVIIFLFIQFKVIQNSNKVINLKHQPLSIHKSVKNNPSDWFPKYPLWFRWLTPVHSAGHRQTGRQRMLTHSRPSGLMGKKQQTREPAECKQLPDPGMEIAVLYKA